jgi:hypothetical protein
MTFDDILTKVRDRAASKALSDLRVLCEPTHIPATGRLITPQFSEADAEEYVAGQVRAAEARFKWALISLADREPERPGERR